MTSDVPSPAALRARLKTLIVESLNLQGVTEGAIGDDDPLFGGSLGLDSVDALELVLAIEREWGLQLQAHEVDKAAFRSIATLAGFVRSCLVRGSGLPATP